MMWAGKSTLNPMDMIVVAMLIGSRSRPHAASRPNTPRHTDTMLNVATASANPLRMNSEQTSTMHSRVQALDCNVDGTSVSIWSRNCASSTQTEAENSANRSASPRHLFSNSARFSQATMSLPWKPMITMNLVSCLNRAVDEQLHEQENSPALLVEAQETGPVPVLGPVQEGGEPFLVEAGPGQLRPGFTVRLQLLHFLVRRLLQKAI